MARKNEDGKEKNQEARQTHQSDPAEAPKYLRSATDVLWARGETRREGREREQRHMPNKHKKYSQL